MLPARCALFAVVSFCMTCTMRTPMVVRPLNPASGSGFAPPISLISTYGQSYCFPYDRPQVLLLWLVRLRFQTGMPALVLFHFQKRDIGRGGVWNRGNFAGVRFSCCQDDYDALCGKICPYPLIKIKFITGCPAETSRRITAAPPERAGSFHTKPANHA